MEKGKNGRKAGEANAAKLKAWLDSVTAIPMLGGQPNKTEIARLAGLKDRQPFTNNPECRRMLAAAVQSKELKETFVDAERERLERRLRNMEIRADKEMAENFELKRELRKLRHIEALIQAGGRVIW